MSPALLLIVAAALAQDATRTDLDESDERNWTPNVESTWGNPEWRRFGDQKIRDDRFMETDYGPVYGATITVHGDGDGFPLRAHKGLGVRLGGHDDQPRAMVVYERSTLQGIAGWLGGWLHHSDERMGLMDRQANAAPPLFHDTPGFPWSRGKQAAGGSTTAQFPVTVDRGRFIATHLNGHDVVLEYTIGPTRVLESPRLEQGTADWTVTRHFEVAPDTLALKLDMGPGAERMQVMGDAKVEDGRIVVPAGQAARRFKIIYLPEGVNDAHYSAPPKHLDALLRGDRPLRWPETSTTTVEQVGAAGGYVHERIVPPFDNPWKSLMFLGGLDFMPNGDPIVSTLFGDVWIVSNIDAGAPSWKRFATGLYQPLGIKVVDGEIFVIERGQLTQLVDHDKDGEADEYRNINNRWHTTGDPHCYDINLETDPQGNWFFIKNGAWHTPTGGCILKVNADGTGDAQVWATGFRHCNSLGMSSDGQLASGGQQGNWQPATRLDLNRQGGFYGLMDAAHDDDIEFYDRPLLWMPLECDNSAGDPVWAPDDWGPLGGELLHLSWGQCWLLHILQDKVAGVQQGAAVVLPLGRMMAGPSRARFSRVDGHLWIAGSMGWQTWGPWDGTLDRIRYTPSNKSLPTPEALRMVDGLIAVTFPMPLNEAIATNPDNWTLSQWNYHWSAGYGSAHWSVRHHEQEGEDHVPITKAHLGRDGRTVFLHAPDLRPAMQSKIGWSIQTQDGEQLQGVAWATHHRLQRSTDIDLKAPTQSNTRPVLANGTVEVRWRGPLHDVEVLVRAVPTEDGHPEGLGIDVDVDGPGSHLLRIELHDRRMTATLDGTQVVDHFETDTRVPLAGTLEVLGAPLSRFELRYQQRPD